MTWTAKELAKMDEAVLQMSDKDFIEHTKYKLKQLPRAQRRAKERELADNVSTMKSLNPKQMRLMVETVNYSCGRAVQQEMDKYNTMMDSAITAYLYTKYPHMTIEEARAEQDIIAKLITEDLTKHMERLDKEGGNEDMANKKVNKMEPEVRGYVGELIDKGLNQGQAIKELCIKFPTLSRSMLTNAFKKVKDERRVEKEAQALEVATEIIEATEYIFGEDKKEEVAEIIEEVEETVEVAVEDEEYKDMIEHSKEVEEEVQPTEKVAVPVEDDEELKITYKQIVVQGKYYKYTIDKEFVKAGINKFRNFEEVEKYRLEQIEKFNKEMAELKKVVGMI